MLALDQTTFGWVDRVLLTLCVALGCALGWLVARQAGSVFFYQMFTPEALMWACGHGFRHPLKLSPEMVSFLRFRNLQVFDCSTIASGTPDGPPGFFFRLQLYLSWTAACLWWLLGPTQAAMAWLAMLLEAGYASGCYVLARLYLGRTPAAVAALSLIVSPVALGLITNLRDFSKGPFFVWVIVLLVLAGRVASPGRGVLLALAGGVVAGIGYGFRSDLAIILAIGAGFLILSRKSSLLNHLGTTAAYTGGFLLLASPVLALGNSANIGSLIMQGATEPFRAFLELRAAPYALGQAYSDELTLSGIAAEQRARRLDWDSHEPSAIYGVSQAITGSSADLAEWALDFAADFAAQALKGAGWILGYPALVAVSRAHPDPAWPLRVDVPLVHWQEPVYALFGQPWMPLIGLLGVSALLLRVMAHKPREALALAAMLLALTTYPAIQFSVRHIFFLEFIWVIGLLSLLCAAVEWRRLVPFIPRFAAMTLAATATIAVIYVGLCQIQQRRLTADFSALLALPREDVPTTREPQSNGGVLIRVALTPAQRAEVDSNPDSMTDRISEMGIENDVRAVGERMVITIGGGSCPLAPTPIQLVYDHRPHIWQPLDTTVIVAPGDVSIFPAFYRATQNFAGVLLPADYTQCDVRLSRLPLTHDLPLVLTAVLPRDWQTLPLRKELGQFGVGPPQ
jgi:hypothetical protein